ncbi:PAS domain S-box protein [Fulvivirga sp. M361]|nr:PAS domain S-box protein [Fulvivirga sp. M361]
MDDVLAQKIVEIRLLQEKLEKYESAADDATEGLWDWDFETGRVFVSKPWRTMLGLSNETPVDTPEVWRSLLHEEDAERVTQHLNDYIAGIRNTYREEFRLKHTNGEYRWILSKAQAIRNENGKVLRLLGSHTDITVQKTVAQALKKSEEKYRNLFQNSLVAMFRSNADTGEILEANDKSKEFLFSNDQAVANFYDVLHDRDRKKLLNKLEQEGSVDNLELPIKTSGDGPIWVSCNAIFYREDNVIECILKDITQTKENLLELQKVNFELDSFVYHASHDLRSPLRSILGLIELYRIETNQSIRAECIEKIQDSVKRLDDLVVELLSISRNDRVNDPHVEINLMLEINNSISSYYNASNTENLQIRTKVLQPVTFKSDLTRVRIILNNLISNAIKYRSYGKDENYIYIDAVVDNEQLVLKVEDNGEGIEESKLPHIFDMFYRATEKSEGSGLGLYIVKKVADKLEASILVESQELEGTTFKVTIPNTFEPDIDVNS